MLKDMFVQFFSSITPCTLIVALVVIISVAISLWRFRIALAEDRQKDLNEIKEEVRDVLTNSLGPIANILDKQSALNDDFRAESKLLKRLLTDKSKDPDSD